MKKFAIGEINIEQDGERPALIVVCDSPSQKGWNEGACLTVKQRDALVEMLGDAAADGVVYISPCRPMPEEIKENERGQKAHLEADSDDFLQSLQHYIPMAKAVVTLGKHGLRQVADSRAAKITKERGAFHFYERAGGLPVMPVQSPANILSRPEIRPIVESDLSQVAAMAGNGWVIPDALTAEKCNYAWSTDLTDLLNDPPEAMAVDTETVGTIWFNRQAILCVQLSWEEGQGIAIPFNLDYWNDDSLRSDASPPKMTAAQMQRLRGQVKRLLENPAIRKTGHNFKFDIHHLRQYGIRVQGWEHDTIQLCHAVDENMQLKSLDECTRRWVPALAGYADVFNEDPIHNGKSRMDLVPHDKMLLYGCGDTDACLRLTGVLLAEARRDARNYRVYEKVKMPALRHLFLQAEEFGLPINEQALLEIAADLKSRVKSLGDELLREAAEQWPGVMRRHMGKWKLSRHDLIRDLLFSPDGLNLTPVVATKKTRMLKPEDQLESTSRKDHLPYFEHIPFVRRLMDYGTLASLLNNFAGRPEEGSWEKVKRTVSGGWPKKLQTIAAAAGVTLPGNLRRRQIQTSPGESATTFEYEDTCYAIDNGEVYCLNVDEAKGLLWFTQNVDPSAIHPDYGLHVAVTGRSNCLAKGEVVVTKQGKKKIEDIVVGDEVWTHQNRWRKVTFLHRDLPDMELYDVHLSNGKVLRCSEQHSLLTNTGDWVTIRDVCIQKATRQRSTEKQRGYPLSAILDDYARNCRRGRNHVPHGRSATEKIHAQGGVTCSQGSKILCEQNRSKESDERENRSASSQFSGGLRGWERLLDSRGGWGAVFCTSNRYGKDAEYSPVETTDVIDCPSYRRRQKEQQPQQSGTDKCCRACGNTQALPNKSGGVEIEKVVPVGSGRVFDIAVDEDASYETVGIFSHNCRGPNLQNQPNRGAEAKAFRRAYQPRPGFILIEGDLSQAELRVSATMANEKTMIGVYAEGGDIHATTAMSVMKLTKTEWSKLTKPQKKEFRQLAKAVNFGLCIAEGQRVLTKQDGYVTIEEIKDWHLVWDGVEWVAHEGVIYKGRKEVIEWDGVTATPDHKVFTERGRIPLREAASLACPIIRTATEAGEPIMWLSETDSRNNTTEREVLGGRCSLQTVQSTKGCRLQQSDSWSIAQLSVQPKVRRRQEGASAWPAIRFDGSEMSTEHARFIKELPRPRDKGAVQEQGGVYPMGFREVQGVVVSRDGLRPDKQRRTLLERKPTISDSERKSKKYKKVKVKVYDLVNAGPRHRFTCEGRLVSNCYGMWWRKLAAYAKTSYGVEMTEEQAESAYRAYFRLYSRLEKWHKDTKAFVRKNKYVRALHGALRRLVAIDSVEESTQREAERQGINAPVQGFSSDLGLMAGTMFANGVDTSMARVVGFIHDSLIIEVREDKAEEAASWLRWCMQNQPLEQYFNLRLPVPIIADIKIGPRLDQMVEREDIVPVRPPWVQI